MKCQGTPWRGITMAWARIEAEIKEEKKEAYNT
jgi:hypothetical protein